MMKKIYLKLGFLLFILSIVNVCFGQSKHISGKVADATSKETLPGVTVVIKGTTTGTITGMDGEFTINAAEGDVLRFSFVGYEEKEVVVNDATNIDVVLNQSVESLEEVVVIGYGSTKKKDATGSVEALNSSDFNKGAITSAQELLSGRMAGVQVTTAGGAPGDGVVIRIRGGSSLSASNDPLIVIDGVTVDSDGISGMRNPLNTIHPSDIESFTVLKDASATAIYGSRASNGVIIITTKKGKKGESLHVDINSFATVSEPRGSVDVLNASEFNELVARRYPENNRPVEFLGEANTDWQDVIFRTSYSQDHNIGITGNIKNIPFRLSAAYTNQNGILKESGLERKTLSLGLNPTFFDDHLRINVNVRGMIVENQFANQGSIGSAMIFDPTQYPLDETSEYGGYFTWLQENGNPINLAPSNPLAMLDLSEASSEVMRSIGNVQLDYKFHFLPELRANLNLGYDISDSETEYFTPVYASWAYNEQHGGGGMGYGSQKRENLLLDFYLNYARNLEKLDSRVDVMAGHSWQRYWRYGDNYSANANETVLYGDTDYDTENYQLSFFGRLNYTFKEKYLLTLTLRHDGSSRFSEDTRWGTFPSMAFAWRIKDEGFLKNVDKVSDLKFRIGYGVTGQQNISSGDYPYLPRYTFSEDNAKYQLGDTFYTTLRPEGYDANIKWEETETYNIGVDYGFYNNRITGVIDAYYKKTNDLINFIPVPGGTNLTNQILTNVGNLENRGVEFSLNVIPIQKKNLTWEIGYNLTYNKNEITKLTATDDPTYVGVNVGGISGYGNTIQIHSVGYPMYSFYVYEQVYDTDGTPLEGIYVDRNNDGIISNDDRYHYKKAAPDLFMGFNTTVNWKSWDLTLAGRIALDNYVYNNVWSQNGTFNRLYDSSGFLSNLNSNVLKTEFENPQYLSDYYIRHASYLRLDNISLGYTFNKVIGEKSSLRLYSTVQNVFVISDYEGLDPEVIGGIDNNIYPRPTTVQLGVNLSF
ncbi:TonB-dependent receptor [uncultured Draconibacterium sp.]|uniref:SusC/RagA family TonB-linked outer membrane protein n=1 Tax=uncultured Draconibacterium sp. TaxID=1573823 RepID=UPI002AA5F42A|nr:TonB-dependent receptor [uncultured Draconibacterium sp.]